MKKIMLFGLFLLFVLIFSGGTLVSAQFQAQYELAGFEIEGNENVSEEIIREKISSEVGEYIEEEKLREDMQSIYELGYFYDIELSFRQEREGVVIIVEVFEHPVLQEIEFEDDPIFSEEKIKEILGIEYGEIINIINLREGLNRLEEKYFDEGYIPTNRYGGEYRFINFDRLDLSNEGELYLPISVGMLNEIIITGNEKTRDFVIERELKFDKAEPLRIPEIQQNLQNLYQLEYFEEINPEIERIDDSNSINLVINFKERKTGTLNFGGGYSSQDGWIGMFNVREENLLGYGQTLGFNWEFGGTRDLSLNFEDPRLFGSQTSFGFDFYDRRVYDTDRRGGSISFGHPLPSEWRGTVKFKLEDFSDLDGDESGKTRSITLETRQDTRNHPFNPTDGGINNLRLEKALPYLGGDQEFTKYSIDTRRYFSGFRDEHSWAFRVNAGFGVGELLTPEKYSLGGSQNLRGYEEFSFRGDNMFLLNLEYRYPIYDRFSGVAFFDTGNTWDELSNMELSDLNSSIGVGLRMNTPIGQIRLDYGINEKGEGRPHFSIGHTF